MQVKSNSRSSVPFQLSVRDPSQHIQTLQENRKFAEDTSASQLSRDMVERGDRSFTIGVPRADNYFPLIRYKCSSELRPVPIVSFNASDDVQKRSASLSLIFCLFRSEFKRELKWTLGIAEWHYK